MKNLTNDFNVFSNQIFRQILYQGAVQYRAFVHAIIINI